MEIPYNSPNINLLRVRLQELRATLISYILQELDDLLVSRDNMASHVQRLIVLGCTEEARERFLNNRTELIKSKTKRIHFYGDAFASTALLSAITFDSIESAFDWYNFSFRDPKLVAGFISWARNEISRFCDLFARQAFRTDLSTEVVAACVLDALENCRRLGYSGLDLTIFLQELLGKAVSDALESRASGHYARVRAVLEEDDFEMTLPVDIPDWPTNLKPLNGHKITTSMVQLAKSSVEFLNEMHPLMQSKLVNVCAAALARFIGTFADCYMTAFYDRSDPSYTRAINLIGNVCGIAELLLPSLSDSFPSQECAELDNLQGRLKTTSEALYSVLSEMIGKQLALKDFSIYAQQATSKDLSAWVTEAIPVLSRLSRDAPAKRRKQVVDGSLRAMVKVFEVGFTEGLIKCSPAGLRRFVIDWRMIERLVNDQLRSHETGEAISEIINQAKQLVDAGDADGPLPRGPAIDTELDRLEATFATFSLDFGLEK